jgi:hypothetical protein
MSKQGRLLLAAGITGLGVGALNLLVQGFTEMIKGGSFREAAKEAVLTSGIIALGTGGAVLGALALTDACPTRALAKR